MVTGNPIVDATPPIITSLLTTSSTEIDLVFSEKVDKVSAETIQNYAAFKWIGNPAIASLQLMEKPFGSFDGDFPTE